ncbi:DUF2975 domain-containing protein [Robertkochia flava]|uniref:DUF2975 domain-containing protein n=1 Tax=Robertkochia flava TaxID=3447986 RepID=UPI001CCA7907|nr:DUF2975 domain-containing protein [Robertkochia marina]
MNNRTLKTAIYVIRLLQLGYLLMVILMLYLLLATYFNWTYPEMVFNHLPHWFTIDFGENEIFQSSFNQVYYAVQGTVLATLILLSLEALIQIIYSIRSLTAFKSDSIIKFRRIGVYTFLCFLITLVKPQYVEQVFSLKISFEFQYLLFACVALMLAEVFKEGNNLWEENQLTI